MIRLKIHRDNAREVQESFFPYLQELCELKMRDAAAVKDNDAKLVARMMLCLTVELRLKFDKKLLTQMINFTLKITDSEAICFYKLLMAFPISEKWVHMIMLRQQITDFLHAELCLP